jgi:hypothetical protein
MNDILSLIDSDISRLQQARLLLTSTKVGTTNRRLARPGKTKRTLSAASRKRIADAQRKRWAALKKAKN